MSTWLRVWNVHYPINISNTNVTDTWIQILENTKFNYSFLVENADIARTSAKKVTPRPEITLKCLWR